MFSFRWLAHFNLLVISPPSTHKDVCYNKQKLKIAASLHIWWQSYEGNKSSVDILPNILGKCEFLYKYTKQTSHLLLFDVSAIVLSGTLQRILC